MAGKALQKARKEKERQEMKNLKRVIYTSSYDRGLEHLLTMWPEVKKAVPQAELHIFYGWQLFDKFYSNNPSSMSWKEKMLKMMEHEGITEHGRVAQPDLEEEYKKSGVWAYPTHFGEINCISALKAQAYGCEPVVVNYAALKETVKYGRKVEGDIYDQETKGEFKKQLIGALQKPMDEATRTNMMKEFSKDYSWKKLANEWSKEFNG